MPRVFKPHAVRRPARRAAALLVSLLCAASACGARAPAGEAGQRKAEPAAGTLEALRLEYARGFLDPAPHMHLAKYFRDHGNRIQAFNILESARRGRFPEDEFNAAFKKEFLGAETFDASPAAEAALLAEHARDPRAHDPVQKLADIYISREEYAKARAYLTKLLEISPDHFEDAEALSEVLRREKKTAEADAVLDAWAAKHPDTEGAYRVRVARVEKEPAKAKPLLAEALRKFPQSAGFHFSLAGYYQREGNYKEAEPLYVKAAELAPGSAYVQAWVGRFFFKAVKDERRALDYYLNAYLLDPHAYETEYVESRIPGINGRLAEAQVRERLAGGAAPADLLSDPNPDVAHLALEELLKKWEPAYVERLVGLLVHEDGGVRWAATQALVEKTDRSFDPRLRELLADADPRRRGLALYVAAAHWKRESHDTLREALKDDSQLVRFDAVSALIMSGDEEARRIAYEHAAREPHPGLKRLIESSMKREAGAPE